MNNNSKLFVAGGSGLVGSSIIRSLVNKGYSNIVANYHKCEPSIKSDSVRYLQLDLSRQNETEDFFENERPDYVFLAAAKVGGILANNTFKAEFIYDNLIIAANVIHAAYKFETKKLLNLGSSCIYPKFAPQPMNENFLLTGELEPTNEAYAVAKIAAIKLCRYYNEQYRTNFISVMPTNLYGLYDNFDLVSSHVLPAMIRKIHLAKLLSEQRYDLIIKDFLRFGNSSANVGGKDVKIDASSQGPDIITLLNHYGIKQGSSNVTVVLWGTGGPYREFLYSEDLADAVVFLMEEYDYQQIGEIINIGSGMDLPIKELAYMIKDTVGFKGDIFFDSTKPDGTPKKLLDVERLHSLGWRPKVDLKEGVRKVYDWYVSQ
ncbi:MAG TPA: GDP-L-fucose synthase [Spirochaetota bacterium]|nr:GDP-L-fucose synthase [Spirochaetota bacterium]